MEIKRTDACIGLETFRLEQGHLVFCGCLFACRFFDGGQVIHFLAQHLADQLDPGKILNLILSHQFAVPQDRDPVADLVDLVQEVGHKDDADSLGLQVAHQAEELLHFIVVQGGGRLIQDQDLAFHVHGPGDGDHLLDRDGAA